MEALNDTRVSLLRDIQQVRSSSNKSRDKRGRIDQLATRYNSLMDQIEAKDISKSGVTDPLQVLPSEIWQEIISLARGDDKYTDLWDIDQLLPFTLVSKSWRQKILSSAILWTHLQLYMPCEDMEAKVTTCLHLSAELPLTISLRASREIWDSIGPTIAAEGHRIRSLSLTHDHDSAYLDPPLTAEILLNMLLEAAGELPVLESLSFHGRAVYAPTALSILKHTNEMRSICYIQISPETFQRNSMRKLRHLVTDQALSDILPHAFTEVDHLLTLTFVRIYGHPTPDPVVSADRDIEKNIQNIVRRSWNLNSLTLDHNPGRLGWSLLEQTSASLRYLQIKIPWTILHGFFTASGLLVQLDTLHLTLPIDSSEKPIISWEIQRCNSIKALYLLIHSPTYTVERDEDLFATRPLAERLGSILPRWVPGVEDLTISTPLEHTFLIPYVCSLGRLAALEVSGCSIPGVAVAPTALTRADSVSINGRSTLFTAFSYPNTLKLRLLGWDNDTGQECIGVYEPLHLHSGRWDNIKFLEVFDHQPLWDDITMPRVEMITVGSAGGIVSRSQSLSPALLRGLALEQNSFPSLHHLRMRCFPEWDMLFIMLERRNFTDSQTVPITNLAFPSFPAPFITKLLVDLLRRRLTHRPSNFSLSVYSIAEAYLDSTLLGCSYCQLALVACSSPTYQHIHKMAVAVEDQRSPYPQTTEEVLATCDERTQWWNRVQNDSGIRQYPCRRHDTYELTEVSEETWDDSFRHMEVHSVDDRRDYSIFGENGDEGGTNNGWQDERYIQPSAPK